MARHLCDYGSKFNKMSELSMISRESSLFFFFGSAKSYNHRKFSIGRMLYLIKTQKPVLLARFLLISRVP